MVTVAVSEGMIELNVIEQKRTEALEARNETGRSAAEINREFDVRQREVMASGRERLTSLISEIEEDAKRETVRMVETSTRERVRDDTMERVRDHLRGFARTIPSFLMAYGDDKTSLETFDKVVPAEVFREVTGITLEEFRFLRDGGTYKDSETGQRKTFSGQLFDPIVFDDSVKEFMRKKESLANYFDEKSEEDIFDYIPPQKTNQIFTPRKVVVRMVDLLEAESPGCFGNPDKTFIDLYMKSGMFITEIVKRLYRNAKMQRLFPNDQQRLRHIFERQVYGLAPTEIIYRIAMNYILGFQTKGSSLRHNFRKLDALPYAKSGTLEAKLSEMYT